MGSRSASEARKADGIRHVSPEPFPGFSQNRESNRLASFGRAVASLEAFASLKLEQDLRRSLFRIKADAP
ncbi:hypothetical protein [Pararhizobium sp. LjRoot238]|uniref:hypothetical protein n=1 Tax=Pararhizobium sp. LjRoot238 TaxID=3342293 RepID=UPI003ECF017C